MRSRLLVRIRVRAQIALSHFQNKQNQNFDTENYTFHREHISYYISNGIEPPPYGQHYYFHRKLIKFSSKVSI